MNLVARRGPMLPMAETIVLVVADRHHQMKWIAEVHHVITVVVATIDDLLHLRIVVMTSDDTTTTTTIVMGAMTDIATTTLTKQRMLAHLGEAPVVADHQRDDAAEVVAVARRRLRAVLVVIGRGQLRRLRPVALRVVPAQDRVTAAVIVAEVLVS